MHVVSLQDSVRDNVSSTISVASGIREKDGVMIVREESRKALHAASRVGDAMEHDDTISRRCRR